ncbi:hypothetical protein CHS0354_035845 [Potamilus streckersoni]|uniref:Uncharacterized protein n=1 Tax=Potamilus streckersoni TaxID=2493646 RepID=A0AAE0SWY1_9BIVA|nr:hypothetical protein CHS0354_035845 [Potamilus streckersoni]
MFGIVSSCGLPSSSYGCALQDTIDSAVVKQGLAMSKIHKGLNQRIKKNPEVASKRCEKADEVKNGAVKDGELPEEERLEQEVSWCVEQLELGLETQQPDSRQAMEAVKILRILTNPKAPLVKKRQAMRNTFGDYRSKMKVQEQKSAASVRKVKMASGFDSSTLKTRFVRRSLHAVKRDKDSKTTVLLERDPCNADKDSADSDQGGTSNSNHGNAEILDSDKVSYGNSNQVNAKMLDMETLEKELRFGFDVMGENGTDNPRHECTVTDCFKFKKSDNSFRFGFSLQDGDT